MTTPTVETPTTPPAGAPGAPVSAVDRLHELAHELDTVATDLSAEPAQAAPAATGGERQAVAEAFDRLKQALTDAGIIEGLKATPSTPSTPGTTAEPASSGPAQPETEQAAPGVLH